MTVDAQVSAPYFSPPSTCRINLLIRPGEYRLHKPVVLHKTMLDIRATPSSTGVVGDVSLGVQGTLVACSYPSGSPSPFHPARSQSTRRVLWPQVSITAPPNGRIFSIIRNDTFLLATGVTFRGGDTSSTGQFFSRGRKG